MGKPLQLQEDEFHSDFLSIYMQLGNNDKISETKMNIEASVATGDNGLRKKRYNPNGSSKKM